MLQRAPVKPSRFEVKVRLYRFLSGYGMLLVLLLLCGYYTWVTWAEQRPVGAAAARSLAKILRNELNPNSQVLIVAQDSADDLIFVTQLQSELAKRGVTHVQSVHGDPPAARRALDEAGSKQTRLEVIACSPVASTWSVVRHLGEWPSLASTKVMAPEPYWWPNFLKSENLLNVANQIVVIAIVAIGMTWVILAGGIDLSVGSLIALSAVLATRFIRDYAGAEHAGVGGLTLCCAAGIAACALVGLGSGFFVTQFGVPPFIVTLGTMLIASGTAFILAQGQSIYQVPDMFIWLGRGTGLFGIPNGVWLMGLMYAAGHLLTERMTFGRYVYAIGGNREASLLSGVPVKRVIVMTYMISGALAGLGGVITASQLKSGAPTYGVMYELYVIAAVVVGGTSLLGGEGKMLGTLIGALIIAVIQNGMNLTGVESYTQKVVLGVLILGAVLLDRFRKFGLDALLRRGPG